MSSFTGPALCLLASLILPACTLPLSGAARADTAAALPPVGGQGSGRLVREETSEGDPALPSHGAPPGVVRRDIHGRLVSHRSAAPRAATKGASWAEWLQRYTGAHENDAQQREVQYRNVPPGGAPSECTGPDNPTGLAGAGPLCRR